MNIELEKKARQERLEYFRDWRKKNKERVKKYNSEYWEKRATKKLKCEKESELCQG